MSREVRLLARKSWRDVRARLGWGLVALGVLVSAGFVARWMLLGPAPPGVWAELERLAASVGVSTGDLPSFLRFVWHEGGIRTALVVLAGIIGAAGPGLDPGGGSRLVQASLPVRPTLPTAVHGAVVLLAATGCAAWVSLLAMAGSGFTAGSHPLSESVGMALTGTVLCMPAAGVGVLAAGLVRRRLTAALLALVGVWILDAISPLLGSLSPAPAPVYDAWEPARSFVPALALTVLLFAVALTLASKVRP